MACRRSLATKSLLLRQRWYSPSLSHIVHRASDSDENLHSQSSNQPSCGIINFCMPQFHRLGSSHGNGGIGALLGHRNCTFALTSLGFSQRFMSSAVGQGPGDNMLGDASEILTEDVVGVVSSNAPAVNEVAVAAADSALPVAALQHLIDAVHSLTGLNWWAAIALTTVLIRGVTLPLLIDQLKSTYKRNLIRPRLEEIRKKVQETGMDPVAVAEGKKQIDDLFRQYGIGPLTPLKGMLIHGSIFTSFFFAISNMVEKVPSFKTGGTLWFTDLTTPDSLIIFPVLASLSFLITAECNMQGLEGNPMVGTVKKYSRILALLSIPFTMGFPKALFCYWITSNLFSTSYGLVLKHPEVRKLLDLPDAPTPSSDAPESTSSPDSTFEQSTNLTEEEPDHQSLKPPNAAARSEAILKQRIRHLEKHLKGKNKKRSTGS